MLRFEHSAEGRANVSEFGSAGTPQGAAALREISAYHQVKEGTRYPAVLLTTGYNDARVEPWQAGKMAARLQAANADGKPVLLRVDLEAGHGPGTARARRLEELADTFSFLLWQMGDPQFQPAIAQGPPAEPRQSEPSPAEARPAESRPPDPFPPR
jgi:prolyl oligopeptidase